MGFRRSGRGSRVTYRMRDRSSWGDSFLSQPGEGFGRKLLESPSMPWWQEPVVSGKIENFSPKILIIYETTCILSDGHNFLEKHFLSRSHGRRSG